MQRLFGETTELRLEKNDLQQQRLAALCCKISKMIGNFTNEFADFERYAFQLCFELSKNKGFLKISKQISDTNLVLRLGNVITSDQVFFLAGKGEKDRPPDRRLGNVIAATSGTLLVRFCLKIKLQHSNSSPPTQTYLVIFAVV